MSWPYRIAAALVLFTVAGSVAASIYGWGLDDDARARARSLRQGGIHNRRITGGGPGFGK